MALDFALDNNVAWIVNAATGKIHGYRTADGQDYALDGRPFEQTRWALITDVVIDGGRGLSETELAMLQTINSKVDASRLGVDIPVLDINGKLPDAVIPDGIAGGISPQGTWNAATNTPTLSAGTATAGHQYIVSAAGTQSITGSSVAFGVGDWVVANGTAWSRIPNPNPNLSASAYMQTVLSATTAAAARSTLGLATPASTGDYNDLSNKPGLGTAAARDVPPSGNASASQVVLGNDTRLSSLLASVGMTEAAFDALLAATGLTADRFIRLTDKPGLHLARSTSAVDEIAFRRSGVFYIGEEPYVAPTDVDLQAGTWASRPVTGFSGGLAYTRRMTDRGPAPGNVHVWDGSGWVPTRGKGVEVTGSRDLAATDDDAVLIYNGTAAVTLTFPTGLSTHFRCDVIQLNTGQVSFSGTQNRSSHTKTAARYARVAVRSVGVVSANVGILSGDTAA